MNLSISTVPLHRSRVHIRRLWSAVRPRVRPPLNRLLRTRIVAAACAPRSIDDYLELFDRTWSTDRVRARIAAVEPEAGGATSLWLAPNEHWRSFRAGQYVRISARVAGVRYDRCFSLSSAPADELLRLTIRALPGGRLGEWAAASARAGGVVELSQALGDFVLPDPLPAKLLFISGGSGITPIMSMIRHLLGNRYQGEITCLHYARDEVIFGQELAALALRHRALRFAPQLTRGRAAQDGAAQVRFSRAQLTACAPAWPDCETFVCGPAPLELAVRALWTAEGLAEHLHVERFVAAAQPIPAGSEPLRCRLRFARSGRVVDAHGSASLLEQAERAGLRPAHGCRMGVCHTCKCTKLEGVVRNELTGALSSEPNEQIQLCVSTPRSDLTLDL